jgi:hypothetical protein
MAECESAVIGSRVEKLIGVLSVGPFVASFVAFFVDGKKLLTRLSHYRGMRDRPISAAWKARPAMSQSNGPEVDSVRARTQVRNQAESGENAATPRWWSLRVEAKNVADTVQFR